jgi:NTE family protein
MSTQSNKIIILTGGGVAGAVQAGMLVAFTEANPGWKPDHIAGASAGALNGVWMSTEFTHARAEQLAEIWSHLEQAPVFQKRSVARFVRALTQRPGIEKSDTLTALVEQFCPVDSLDDTLIPIHVVATCIETLDTTWFSNGPAVERLIASASIPGLIRPTLIDRKYYVDGCALTSMATGKIPSLNPEKIVLFDISPPPKPPKNPSKTSALNIVLACYSSARHRAAKYDQLLLEQLGIEVHRYAPPLPDWMESSSWDRTSDLVDYGKQWMQDQLESLH